MTGTAHGRDVVFTALFGGYEPLNEQPAAHASDARFVCFTDDSKVASESWEIRVVKPLLPGDPSRSSRFIKTLAYREFGKSRSLYIDNSVQLKGDPASLLDAWLADQPIAMMPHESRQTVSDEIATCLRYGVDAPGRLREQRNYYRQFLPEALAMRPFWGGMIARRSDAGLEQLMKTWFTHILRFSRRDQISLPAASLQTGVSIRKVSGLNSESEWHDWPVVTGRSHGQRIVTARGRARRLAGDKWRMLRGKH